MMSSRSTFIYVAMVGLDIAILVAMQRSALTSTDEVIFQAAIFIVTVVCLVGAQIVHTLEHNALRIEQAVKQQTSVMKGQS